MSFGGTKKEAIPTWQQFVLGGLSGCGASLCTHPLDTIKVRMQLSGMNTKASTGEGIFTTGLKVTRNEGLFALYKGLSASLLRQATYTTARFGFYLKLKDIFEKKSSGPMPWYSKLMVSMIAGSGGAIVGSPADVVLVRMQADGKKPLNQRANYKNVFDGLYRIAKEEGIGSWWRGCLPNVYRAALMSAGQLASYDQAKQFLLLTPYFKDNTVTHFTASLIAAFVATVLTNPLDVIKTRIMDRKKGDLGIAYKGSLDAFMQISKTEGLRGLYKGFIPFFARLGPQTILTFIFFEKYEALFRVIFPR